VCNTRTGNSRPFNNPFFSAVFSLRS